MPRRVQTGFRWLLVLVAFAALLPRASVAAAPAEEAEPGAPPYALGEIVVGWNPASGAIAATPRAAGALDENRAAPEWQAAAAQLMQRTGLAVLDAQPRYGYARLAVTRGREWQEIERLRRDDWVKYAEPNYVAYSADAPADYPNDPRFGEQWNMRRIDAPQAWSVTRGSFSFIVAVLDTGVDRWHPDLAGRLLPGRNYVDTGNFNPDDDAPDSHGTHVTGMIAANTDNATGVAGLAPQVKILPLKVLDWQGAGFLSDIADGIRYATDYGAQVINLSLGSLHDASVLSDAVYYALGQGRLVVAAGGNCARIAPGCPATNPDVFPAAYPGVVAVAASDHFDRWSGYSGFRHYTAIAAPGGAADDGILSTVRGGGYDTLYGTSMATPHVAAAAALVWTLAPALSYSQVTDVLKNTADKVGTNALTGAAFTYNGGRNDYFGYGRLNVNRAVRWVYPPGLEITGGRRSFMGGSAAGQSATFTIANPSGQGVWWQAEVLAGGEWLRVLVGSGTASFETPGALTIALGPAAGLPWPAAGSYQGIIRVRAAYPAGIADQDIRIELLVPAHTNQVRLPLVWKHTPATTWLDPFAPQVLDRRQLPLGDDMLLQENLPFPVLFYGGAFTSLWVSDNGYVLFGQPAAGATRPPAGCLRTAEAPNGGIYVNAADWKPAAGGGVYVHKPDGDTVVVTWVGVRTTSGGPGQTFQLVLVRDAAPRLAYQSVDAQSLGIVGAENYDGTLADEIYCKGKGRAPGAGDNLVLDVTLPW